MGLDRGGAGAVSRVGAVGAAMIAAMPVPGASLPASAKAAMAPTSANAPAGPSAGGIGTVIIQVTVQGGGSDGSALGRQIGRETAAEFRRRLYDGE